MDKNPSLIITKGDEGYEEGGKLCVLVCVKWFLDLWPINLYVCHFYSDKPIEKEPH